MRFRKIYALFLIGILLITIWRLNIFSVEKVVIYSYVDCVSEQDLKRGLDLLGKNPITLNVAKVKAELASKHLCIKDIDISYEFPRKLKIYVYGRKFFSKIVPLNQTNNLPDFEASSSSEAALLDWNFPLTLPSDMLIADETGFIFTSKQPNFPLPTLFLSENLILGKQINKRTFGLINQIFTEYLELEPMLGENNIVAKKYGNILLINSPVKVAFSLQRDVLRQFASLQLILQKAKIDSRVVEIVDLRFDKPVIEYQPKSSK